MKNEILPGRKTQGKQHDVQRETQTCNLQSTPTSYDGSTGQPQRPRFMAKPIDHLSIYHRLRVRKYQFSKKIQQIVQ